MSIEAKKYERAEDILRDAARRRAMFFPPVKPRFCHSPRPVIIEGKNAGKVTYAGAEVDGTFMTRVPIEADEHVKVWRANTKKDEFWAKGDPVRKQVLLMLRQHGLTLEAFHNDERKKSTVRARRDIALFLRNEMGVSIYALAKIFRRDHTTIYYYLNNPQSGWSDR